MKKVIHRPILDLVRRDLKNTKITFKQIEPHIGTITWLKDQYPNDREIINLEKMLRRKVNHLVKKKTFSL